MGEDDDPMVALVAHGLLNSIGAIAGATSTLQRRWHDLDDDHRDQLLAIIANQTAFIRGVLGDLARGLPPAVLHGLPSHAVDAAEFDLR